MKPRRIEALWMAAALAAAAPMLAMPIGDPDLWWHLSAARRMLDTWSFPRADWLSFTRAGAPWVDFEWLSQLALGGAWGAGRMAGLLALKIALLLWAGWWLERGMRARGVRAPERAAALALCAAAMIPRSDARTELFSFVFFAALTRRDEAPRPAPAAGLFALWANLHAGFAYGLLFLGALAAGRLWEAFGPARRRTAMGEARSALAALGAAVAGTLANPYGWGVYRVLARHAREVGSLPGLIAEWGPLSLRRPPHWPAWAALACAVWVLTRPGPAARRPRPGRLLCLALLGLAAWRHSRAAPYFCLLAAPWCVPELLAGAGAPAALRSAGAAAFLAAGAGLGLKLALPLGAFRAAWHAGYLPLESAAYLARRPELARRNVYNPWGWGGYLGFRLAPDLRVFQDGRYIFHDLLLESSRAVASPADWAAFLVGHRVDVALVENIPLAVAGPGGLRPFYAAYLPREDWALLHFDRQALVFARRAAFRPGELEAAEYRVLRPQEAESRRLAEEAVAPGLLERERERRVSEEAALARPPWGDWP